MFQFPALATMIQSWTTVLQTAGLSHSEIRGSKVMCTYPQLIAAYHVLHSLNEPRHPPYALSYFLYDNPKLLIPSNKNGRERERSYFQLYFYLSL